MPDTQLSTGYGTGGTHSSARRSNADGGFEVAARLPLNRHHSFASSFPLVRVVRTSVVLIAALASLALIEVHHSATRLTSAAGGAVAPPPGTYHLDRSFAGGVIEFPGWEETLTTVVRPDGSVLVLLRDLDQSGALLASGVAHLRADGSLDPTFAASGPSPGIARTGAWGVLTVRADGRFLVGTRAFLANGEVDHAFGADGWVGYDSELPTALTGTAVFESSTGQLMVVNDEPVSLGGCAVVPIDETGHPQEPTFTWQLCHDAVALRLPDGVLLAIHSPWPGSGTQFVRLRPNGSLDTSYGGGTGFVVVEESGALSHLTAAALVEDDVLLAYGGILSSTVVRVDQAGRLDPSFAGGGSALVNGLVDSILVQDGVINLGIGYTYELRAGMPHHPAVTRWTSSGELDTTLNPGGHVAGWFDLVDAGVEDFAFRAFLTADGSDLLMGTGIVPVGTGKASEVVQRAILVGLAPGPASLVAAAGTPAERLGVLEP